MIKHCQVTWKFLFFIIVMDMHNGDTTDISN